jgi:hypothetical protein
MALRGQKNKVGEPGTETPVDINGPAKISKGELRKARFSKWWRKNLEWLVPLIVITTLALVLFGALFLIISSNGDEDVNPPPATVKSTLPFVDEAPATTTTVPSIVQSAPQYQVIVPTENGYPDVLMMCKYGFMITITRSVHQGNPVAIAMEESAVCPYEEWKGD